MHWNLAPAVVALNLNLAFGDFEFLAGPFTIVTFGAVGCAGADVVAVGAGAEGADCEVPPPVPVLLPPPLDSPPVSPDPPPPPFSFSFSGSGVTADVALSPEVSPATVAVAVTSLPTGTPARLTSHLPSSPAVALPTKLSISFRNSLWVAKTRTVAPGAAVPVTLGCSAFEIVGAEVELAV